MVHFLDIKDTLHLYNEVFKLWNSYIKNLNIKFHTIKYEDIILNFDRTISSLISFLSLDWEDKLRDYSKTALNRVKINTPSYNQVTKPLHTDSIARWIKFKNIVNKLYVESMVA